MRSDEASRTQRRPGIHRMWIRVLIAAIGCLSLPITGETIMPTTGKTRSVFFSQELRQTAQENVRQHAWAAEIRDRLTSMAQPWMKFSDDQLWEMMYGPTIPRSWMVWSTGRCPSCKAQVPMYTWEIKAFEHPWKVVCPHCREQFPKNDFAAFYKSGLDERGVFDSKLADRRLLYNSDHPDASDPLHTFGVDDGNGYVEGKDRWRFVGTYLVYGQWKQLVVAGIRNLAAAYVITGEPAYAHKAGILLDRVADLFPDFDYHTQGYTYERPESYNGYVSVWHDSCQEVYDMTLAYDEIYDGIRADAELTGFLAAKASQHKLVNSKSSFADIQRNIEERILRDSLKHDGKIQSNFPRREVTRAVIKTVLDWPGNRDEVYKEIDKVIAKSTSVDGVTGEKGLTGYASFALHGFSMMLQLYNMLDPQFMADAMKRYPQLKDTFRFHIDTWCFGQYYPAVGDCSGFAEACTHYAGIPFPEFARKDSEQQSQPKKEGRPGSHPGDDPSKLVSLVSMYGLFWHVYELTGEEAYAQVLYMANGNTAEGLPRDPFIRNCDEVQRRIADIVSRKGAVPSTGSTDKKQWHIAILKSHAKEHPRALWLHYDANSNQGHSHMDGMTLGLFSNGLDLMPDFGYPPVQYGGWCSTRAMWYRYTFAHNTVAVDGTNHRTAAGTTTLSADGQWLQAVRASCPAMTGGRQFERTAALVGGSDPDCYVMDVFRVEGGTSHTKFMQSHFGTVTADGLHLEPAGEFGHGTVMRNLRRDAAPPEPWHVDWTVEDKYSYLAPGSQVHVRYTDLTRQAQAMLAEGWIAIGGYNGTEQTWIPRVMVQRRADKAPLASTFVSLVEPYETKPVIATVRRLELTTADGRAYPEQNVAVEAKLSDGRTDLFACMDAENALGLNPSLQNEQTVKQADWGLSFKGELCHLRRSTGGGLLRVALCKGTELSTRDFTLKLKASADLTEVEIRDGKPVVVTGSQDNVEEMRK